MEGTVPGNMQDGTVKMNLEPEGVLKLESKNVSSVNSMNSELNAREDKSKEVNGQVDIKSGSPGDCEYTNGLKCLQEKTHSPTLIESAFKVMKNLFSPDKTKSKGGNLVNPGQIHKSCSGSPTNSICISTINSESGTENGQFFPSGENNMKNQLNVNQVGVLLSPLNVESHNNTDESFLTTVSITDDSFHSAITNLDENGESGKLEVNAIDNFLNGSQNVDMTDFCNDTLDNSDYCLENTTLKNGSFASEGTKVGSVSDLSKDGNGECWTSCQINGICEGRLADDSGKIGAVGTEGENFSEGAAKTELLQRGHSMKEGNETEQCPGLNDSNKIVKMENLFMNESFDTQLNALTSSETFTGEMNLEDDLEEETKVELKCCKVGGEEIEMCSEDLAGEGNIDLENCISTTTVILNSADSAELDQLLTSLKEEALDLNSNSSQISITGSVESASRENLFQTQFSKEVESEFPIHKPHKNKSSVNENDSSNNAYNLNKVKLNKSDELVNHRISSESPERTRVLHKKKSSLDMSLIKGSDSPEKLGLNNDSELKFNFKTEDLNARKGGGGGGRGGGEVKNSGLDVGPKATTSVISQQSYTILTARDTSLNRPIIEPVSDTITFQDTNLDKYSAGMGTSETSGNYCNSSLGATESTTPVQPKQSTPLWKGNTPSDNCHARVKPTSLNLNSPKASEEKRETKHLLASHESNFAKDSLQLFPSSDDPAEFSPVNPITESEALFSNFVENEVVGSQGASNLHGTAILSNEKSENSVKKLGLKSRSGSPQVNKMNESFEESKRKQRAAVSSEGAFNCEKLNATFDTTPGFPLVDKTFTMKVKSLEIGKRNETFVVSGSPEGSEMNESFNNKTFVGKGLNQTFDKKPKSSPVLQTGRTVNERGVASTPNVANETFVKDKDEEGDSGREKMQEMNKTFEVGKAPKDDRVVEVEARGKNEKSFDQSQVPTDVNGSAVSGRSSNTSSVVSDLSTLLLNDDSSSRNQSLDDLAGKMGKLNLNESLGGASHGVLSTGNDSLVGAPMEELNAFPCSASLSDEKLRCDPYLVQLIQEQFSSNDIEKICSVVDDFSSMKLNADILKASEQFDKSFHEHLSSAEAKPSDTEPKPNKLINPLSPQSFDFLSSIQGKPTGRDWSRESLYVKFDPLVQPNPNSLIDFTKEGEALLSLEKSPVNSQESSVCEQLLTISPQKKPDEIVPPLTPLSHRSKTGKGEEKMERIKELQNEIYFLKNLYAERERTNKAKIEDYESQVTKLTGESCFLENKLKESNEREKALVKKIKEQNESLAQLKIIMEEYVKVISKLSAELEAVKAESERQIEALTTEKDSYMTHLQNTEAAFTDVHTKYEKSKKTIVSLKSNEVMYRNTVAEQGQRVEELQARALEIQEKACQEIQKVQEELSEAKASHGQETARLRAQLRKTELKMEALQDSLDQKIKENQKLTAICDELIEGKK